MKVRFYTRSKNNNATIYIRFQGGRQFNIVTRTKEFVNPKYFDNKMGRVRMIALFRDKEYLRNKLGEIETHVWQQYRKIRDTGVDVTKEWFKNCIGLFYGDVNSYDDADLFDYCHIYIEFLRKDKAKRTEATIKKYSTIKTKIQGFNKYRGNPQNVSEGHMVLTAPEKHSQEKQAISDAP